MTNDTNSMINKSLNVNSLSPIALFVFNRPRHTRLTVEALCHNELAAESDLFVFSDGPRSDNDFKAVQEVRDYIRSITGFHQVTIIERHRNLGLAQSIILGVTEIVNRYGRIVVFEDDLVTSRFFLKFMNDAFSVYENESKVMHISGGTYPIDDFSATDTYFLRIPLCWGWGTWKRAWDSFNKNIDIMKKFDNRMIAKFNFDGTYPFWEQLELNKNGQLRTWFVFLYATIFLHEALALFPSKSLVNNIGHDGSGVHCDKSDAYDVELSQYPINVMPIALEESRESFIRHKKYFRCQHSKLYLKIFQKIRRAAKRVF